MHEDRDRSGFFTYINNSAAVVHTVIRPVLNFLCCVTFRILHFRDETSCVSDFWDKKAFLEIFWLLSIHGSKIHLIRCKHALLHYFQGIDYLCDDTSHLSDFWMIFFFFNIFNTSGTMTHIFISLVFIPYSITSHMPTSSLCKAWVILGWNYHVLKMSHLATSAKVYHYRCPWTGLVILRGCSLWYRLWMTIFRIHGMYCGLAQARAAFNEDYDFNSIRRGSE